MLNLARAQCTDERHRAFLDEVIRTATPRVFIARGARTVCQLVISGNALGLHRKVAPIIYVGLRVEVKATTFAANHVFCLNFALVLLCSMLEYKHGICRMQKGSGRRPKSSQRRHRRHGGTLRLSLIHGVRSQACQTIGVRYRCELVQSDRATIKQQVFLASVQCCAAAVLSGKNCQCNDRKSEGCGEDHERCNVASTATCIPLEVWKHLRLSAIENVWSASRTCARLASR